jgi:hypothetical protein
MWTLVIIVVMSSVQGGSGTSSSIHSVGNFSSQQKCDDAAKTIANAGVVKGALQANGVYEIRTLIVLGCDHRALSIVRRGLLKL